MPKAKPQHISRNERVFRSIEEVRETYLPRAKSIYSEGALDNPQQVAAVMAANIVREVAQDVEANRRR